MWYYVVELSHRNNFPSCTCKYTYRRENEQLHYSFLGIPPHKTSGFLESCGSVGEMEAGLSLSNLIDFVSFTCPLLPKEPSKNWQDQDIRAHSD